MLQPTAEIFLQNGLVPLAIWVRSSKIEQRLDLVCLGNLGNFRSVGEGVCELKIDYCPGYRVYFAQIGATIVLLLCGGDKGTQDRDIRKAKEYWIDYEQRENAYE
jgi:putative addiction module killer protein